MTVQKRIDASGNISTAETSTVSTTDATTTICGQFTTQTDAVYYLEAVVLGIKDDQTAGFACKLLGGIRNDSGTATIIAQAQDLLARDDAGHTCDFAINGGDATIVQVEVVGGAGDNMDWQVRYVRIDKVTS